MIKNFINELTKCKNNYPSKNFSMLGWINSDKIEGWTLLIGFILGKYGFMLQELGLYKIIRATQYEISNNSTQFFTIMELNCPFTSNYRC